jgi:hypothetical protein
MNKTIKRSLWKADKFWIGNRHRIWEICLIKVVFPHKTIYTSSSQFPVFYNGHGYDPHVSTSLSFPHSWLIDGFVLRVQWRVPLMEQELLALLEYLNSPPVFNGVRVAQFFLLCVLFCRSLFVLFSFDHCVCLVFFDLRIMIIPVVSSNSSYKKKFKQRWSTIPPISTKRTTTSNNWTVKKRQNMELKIQVVVWKQVNICGWV